MDEKKLNKHFINRPMVALSVATVLALGATWVLLLYFQNQSALETEQLKMTISELSVKIDELSGVSSPGHVINKRSTSSESGNPDAESSLNEMSYADLIGLRGPPGKDGRDGSNGRDGRDGRDCDASDEQILAEILQELKNLNEGEDLGQSRSGGDWLQTVNQTLGRALVRALDRTSQRVSLLENQVKAHNSSGAGRSNSGATYIRWGRTECPQNSELLYEGFVGGQQWSHTGGASNKICLPLDPEWSGYTTTAESSNWVYSGGYYLVNNNAPGLFPSYYHGKNTPCATCFSSGRLTMLMIPAKRNCPDSTWTKEYEGYLMAERYNHQSSDAYTCVDASPEIVNGFESDHASLFYFVQTACNSTGHCPPYIDNAELTCVVCTK